MHTKQLKHKEGRGEWEGGRGSGESMTTAPFVLVVIQSKAGFILYKKPSLYPFSMIFFYMYVLVRATAG